jgi:hypothetical protein
VNANHTWLTAPLSVIIGLYLVLGVAYAVFTPAWQIPDEPAHYNYIAHVVHTGQLPVLEPGDYPFDYLEEIKAARFPPSMSIEPIDYEAHQPPLYYLLAVPLFASTADLPLNQQLVALRLLSVIAGGGLLFLTYHIVQTIFSHDTSLALTTTALVAFIPMHITMTAAVNNDALAELVVASILFVSVLRAYSRLGRQQFVLVGGVLYGLGLLTKTTTYPAVIVLFAGEAVHWWLDERGKSGFSVRPLVTLAGVALALSLWWFTRNAVVYGSHDVFGLERHDAVVVGQPRTADWIAQHGWVAYWDRAGEFTFKSFWGIFGWMGVFMDQRIYVLLALLTGVAVVGFILYLMRDAANPARTSNRQRAALGLLGLDLLLTMVVYVWYNTTFVQHQGRYLFPGLIAIALFAALGWRQVTPRPLRAWLPVVVAAGLASLDVVSLFYFVVPNLAYGT